MIQSIADHMKENAAAWFVAIFVSGFTFAGSATWFLFNLYTDIQLVKCKVGVTQDNPRCEWTTTIVEDLDKANKDEDEEA